MIPSFLNRLMLDRLMLSRFILASRRSLQLSRSVIGLLVACLFLSTAQGCGWFRSDDPLANKGPKLGDMVAKLPELELPKTEPIIVSREDVMAAYERVYGLIPDGGQNHAIGKRLADLEMDVGEDRDIEGATQPYEKAVSMYEQLLASADGEGKDEILYQLSRAHDVGGNSKQTVVYLDRLIAEYPDSQYIPEVRFRRAEIAFSQEDYRAAADNYRFVVALGDSSNYQQNAQYMYGWSEFKLGDVDAALDSFFDVIHLSLAKKKFDDLKDTEQEIVDDSFRVSTLALGYLDGAETLAELMEGRKRPSWQYLAYERLAANYLEQERYLDSVATWAMFIDRNSLDERAPAAHLGMIQTLIEADFPSEIRPRKEEFVARYGVRSEFWQVHDDDVRGAYMGKLKEYLGELSKLAHSEAQSSTRQPDYLKAADWYEQYVATFPKDPAVAEYLFLLGEVYTEAGEHARAVASYQQVMREHPQFPRASEAGYAAILGYDTLVGSAPVDELELWKRLKIDAQLEFAIAFANDERAPAVQTAAADALFDLGDYEQSVEVAQNVLDTWSAIAPELVRTAYLIIGHGWFELGGFATAEVAYLQLLNQALDVDNEVKVRERLLAAVYKQGEAAEAEQRLGDAVNHFLRLKNFDEHAEITAQGHFDAVAIIEGTGEQAQAAALLQDFRSRYPNHQLAAGIDKRLAGLYEATEDFSQAAAEYVRIAHTDPDVEVRRQSLFRAAQLYLEMEDSGSAITQFTEYANTYKTPADLNLEAIHNLDLLYQENGDGVQRRIWLAEKINLHKSMGANATERATFLAAEAQYVFATDEHTIFESLQLGHPLNQTLKAKQSQLKATVKAFERVAEYQVTKFSTASTYYIADLYASLSISLMESDRPADLSELEMAQYDILLEEQAFPFEEQAITLHEINMRRSWNGVYDEWVQKSFEELGRLMPARFNKHEVEVAYVDAIH